MQQKQHITHKGLLEIVKIKASLNLGLTDTLRSAFPNICATPRLLIIEKKKIPHSLLIAGFTSGEGNFQVLFCKDRFKGLVFKINQHNRDERLIISFMEYGGVVIITLV